MAEKPSPFAHWMTGILLIILILAVMLFTR